MTLRPLFVFCFFLGQAAFAEKTWDRLNDKVGARKVHAVKSNLNEKLLAVINKVKNKTLIGINNSGDDCYILLTTWVHEDDSKFNQTRLNVRPFRAIDLFVTDQALPQSIHSIKNESDYYINMMQAYDTDEIHRFVHSLQLSQSGVESGRRIIATNQYLGQQVMIKGKLRKYISIKDPAVFANPLERARIYLNKDGSIKKSELISYKSWSQEINFKKRPTATCTVDL